LLRALGTKNDARYNLKIVDNGDGSGGGGYANDSGGTSDDDSDDTAKYDDTESDVVSKTRKELESYDDLDV
jgi:hypothetical protein